MLLLQTATMTCTTASLCTHNTEPAEAQRRSYT